MVKEQLTQLHSNTLNHIVREWKGGLALSALDKFTPELFDKLRTELTKHTNAVSNRDMPARVHAEIAIVELLKRV